MGGGRGERLGWKVGGDLGLGFDCWDCGGEGVEEGVGGGGRWWLGGVV